MTAYSPRRSDVFIIRIWTEEFEEQLIEMRGMVRNVHSGETRYFRTWQDLLCFVASRAHQAEFVYDCAPELPCDPLGPDPDRTPDGRD